MCGVIGYIGENQALPILTSGLKRMEYRGYDSAGVATIDDGRLEVVRAVGKIKNLLDALDRHPLGGTVGIGHTRWATHGEPSEVNAHPHRAGHIAVVHNGIIENYAELKAELTAAGASFHSTTDTEVLAQLIAAERAKTADLAGAVVAALAKVEGTYGLLVIDEREPGVMIAARHGSPLLIGLGKNEIYAASDATALINHTDNVVYLNDDEIAVCDPTNFHIIDLDAKTKKWHSQKIDLELGAIEKGGYPHFLLKEIMEQPRVIADTLRGRLDDEAGTSHLGGLSILAGAWQNLSRILVVGCGTAYYAGLLGKYLVGRLTGLPVDVEFGSEFRYRDPIVSPGTLGVIISQSGETADTLASLRELKRLGVPTLGLVNVVGSSITREVDGGVYLHAGPEISVASTKAFTAQVIAELLVGLNIGRRRGLSLAEGREVIAALRALPAQVQALLDQHEKIQALAHKLAHFDNVMYLGRDALYPVALEASHKLKEISYIHAEAYPAGEMKHGANALIDEDLLVIYFNPRNELYDKSRSNLEEVRARHGQLLIVGTEGDESLAEFSTDVIYIPECSSWTQSLLVNIPMQLFAYYMAVERGTDVDQPRNLAKSVTVE